MNTHPTKQPKQKRDELAWWLLSILGVALAVNLLTDVMPAVGVVLSFAVVLAVAATRPGGRFSRDPGGLGPTPLGRSLAVVAGLAYLGAAILLALNSSTWLTSLAALAALWLCTVLLVWRSLVDTIPASIAAVGVAFLLGGATSLLYGAPLLRGENLLGGVGNLLGGVALLLIGVAILRNNGFRPGVGARRLAGIGILLCAAAFFVFGVSLLGRGLIPLGGGYLLGAAGLAMSGVAIILVRGDTLGDPVGVVMRRVFGVACLLLGVPFFVATVMLLDRGEILAGIAAELAVLGVLAIAMALFVRGAAFFLMGVAFLLMGVASLLLGAAALLGGGGIPFGVGDILIGVAILATGVMFLLRQGGIDLDEATLGRVADTWRQGMTRRLDLSPSPDATKPTSAPSQQQDPHPKTPTEHA